MTPSSRTRPWAAIAAALALAAGFLLHSGASAQPAAQPPSPAPVARIVVEAFVRDGCAHCEEAERFLAQLARERPDISVVIRDVRRDRDALRRLNEIASEKRAGAPRVPAVYAGGQLIVGFSEEASTGTLIRDALRGAPAPPAASGAGSCEADDGALGCAPGPPGQADQAFAVEFLGRTVTLDDVGLPAFTLAIGLLDGLNPCAMWVLVLMISLLAPLQDRRRMLAVAGVFVLIQGIAYFLFLSAWLNLFLLVGLSRASQLAIAGIAIIAGLVNVKDFVALGRGFSLSIPDSAKPGIYARMRAIVHAERLPAAIAGVVVLALLVQVVELMCTTGFPALFTRILTLRELDPVAYYAYLLLYVAAYMLDDAIVLGVGVVTLSRHRLQEKEGRWLKLISGVAMIGLGAYLIVAG